MMTEKRRGWVEVSGGKNQRVTGELKMASEAGGQTMMVRRE